MQAERSTSSQVEPTKFFPAVAASACTHYYALSAGFSCLESLYEFVPGLSIYSGHFKAGCCASD